MNFVIRNFLLNSHFCNEKIFPLSRVFLFSFKPSEKCTLNNSDACNDDDGQGNDNSCYTRYTLCGVTIF